MDDRPRRLRQQNFRFVTVMGAVDELGVGVVGMEEGAVQIDCVQLEIGLEC